jgi:ribonuclease HII
VPVNIADCPTGWHIVLVPTLDHETKLWLLGHKRVAGLDEVGRGAWAGPVVAAAVILPSDGTDLRTVLRGVNDSKRLTPRMREALVPRIIEAAVAVGIGMASAQFIDARGIVQATRQAMALALRELPDPPQALLIDALILPDIALPQHGIVKGDSRVLSIAAASIVAKVFRDQLMRNEELYFPGYGFARHKGYGTAQHRAALSVLGPSPIHRLTFTPVRSVLAGESPGASCSNGRQTTV